jgi:hypothetical protein
MFNLVFVVYLILIVAHSDISAPLGGNLLLHGGQLAGEPDLDDDDFARRGASSPIGEDDAVPWLPTVQVHGLGGPVVSSEALASGSRHARQGMYSDTRSSLSFFDQVVSG